MSDYGIFCKDPDFTVIPDETFSEAAFSEVQSATSQKNMYASALYELLSGLDS